MSDAFTTYVLADVLRLVIAAGSFWLAALVLQICWTRRGTGVSRPDRPQFLTYLSFAGCLVMLGTSRIENIGHPIDWSLPASTVFIVLGFVGVIMRTRLGRPGRDKTP